MHDDVRRVRTLARYSVAFFSVAIALALTVWLGEFLAPMRLFFLWVAVLIAALFGGTVPGLLATALAVLSASWFVFLPGQFAVGGTADVIRLTLFAAFATGISIAVGRAKLLSERLRRSETRYRTIVEATPVAQAMWTATPDGAVMWAPEWLAITGQTMDDLAAGRGMSAVHPDDLPRTRDRWTHALAHGTLYEDTIRVRLRDGSYRWFASQAAPVRDGDRIVEWTGIIIDVHERKQHEETASFINRASEVLSSTLDSREAMRNLARLCVPALGDCCAIHLGEERVVLEPPGAELPAEALVAPMVARGRTLGKLVLAARDPNPALMEELARRAAMALDNARLYEEADAANRAKDNFLATLSHELRTPLTAIAGWAHMLQHGIEDEGTRKLAVETIVRSAETQKELIDDLLDLSRVVAGTMQLDVQPVDLLRIVHEVLVAARPAAEAKGIALTQEADSAAVVRGDERRLRQIVWNLVTNAVKFTERSGSATVRLSANEAMARVEVSDSGKGIDAAFLPYVWDRFRQADSSTSRAHGGLGLGLAVVRHLVEMHGGTVHAESAGAGKGAKFVVEIPLAKVSS
ncbi:MAG TPA: ATP-binding protein [Thermoanaerobaculia bacterium]|nr:ATP-binding protein [Thermoanaerobaculia bacterium]